MKEVRVVPTTLLGDTKSSVSGHKFPSNAARGPFAAPGPKSISSMSFPMPMRGTTDAITVHWNAPRHPGTAVAAWGGDGHHWPCLRPWHQVACSTNGYGYGGERGRYPALQAAHRVQ